MKANVITAELKRIASEHGGILRPADVIAEARPAKSVLHSRFEWDDTVAGREYRLWQARHLIRVCVEVSPRNNTPMEVFVSLTPDRGEGGYRVQARVLSNRKLRAQLLADAKAEAQLYMAKYARLKELGRIFDSIRATFGVE